MAKTIEGCWQEFARRVVHADACDTQLNDMRLTFYAGVSAMFSLSQEIGRPDVSEAEGCRRLTGWMGEIERFVEQIKGPARTVQ